MGRTITVDTYTQVAAEVPVLARGFTLKCGWLYEDGRIIGDVRAVVDETPTVAAQDFVRHTLPVERGPFVFFLW